MAFYGNDGEIVTQGDQELMTIASCLGLVGEVAALIFDEPVQAESHRRAYVALSGRVAMTFFMTPFDPIDTEPKSLTLDEMSIAADLDASMRDAIETELPGYGRAYSIFPDDEAELIKNALEFRRQCPPVNDKDIAIVAQAELMLQQLAA